MAISVAGGGDVLLALWKEGRIPRRRWLWLAL